MEVRSNEAYDNPEVKSHASGADEPAPGLGKDAMASRAGKLGVGRTTKQNPRRGEEEERIPGARGDPL